jgi:hypothetical protein
MKINYTTTRRTRRDTIRVVVAVDEDSEPIYKRGNKFQPTTVHVEFEREVVKDSSGRDVEQLEWDTNYSVQAHRVLKAGGLGQQVTRLYIYGDEDQHPWLANAMKIAEEEFRKIISNWPDPEWPEDSLPVL